VLGYWLGAELAINSTYRYVAYGADIPFPERSRLMKHVMHIDQHVRYALVLQAGLGFALSAMYGYVPGVSATAWSAAILAAAWLAFIEVVHRRRGTPSGLRLAAFDRRMRYVIIVILVAIALGLVGAGWSMPPWLRLKLALFAGVIASGVGIRLALLRHFRTFALMEEKEGPSEEANEIVRRTYVRATSILVLLWVFIAAIVVVSMWKPA
jgi:hypothetical protein